MTHTLTPHLWDTLETGAWSSSQDLAEALTWLLYARWLEGETGLFPLADCDKRWSFWRELSLRQRFRHLRESVWPFLQSRAPMTGHLLGLILPTLPFAIPDAVALSQLLDLIEAHPAQELLEALLPLLDIEEPTTEVLAEAIAALGLAAEEVVWEPHCRSGRFLATCARTLQQRHWRTIWAEPEKLRRFRQQQFFGRVQRRPEALLSAMNLLLAGQLCPGLDGYSLPWPPPSLIWVLAPEPDRAALLSLLAPGGRLVIWQPGSRGHLPLSGGQLEILEAPMTRQLKEAPATYISLPATAKGA
ncbi:MAG: hypothetical protein ACAI44_15185 [Candidatus Sericytochromatia bacterium]